MYSIELKDEAIQAALARLQGGMSDMSPVMSQIAEYMVKSAKERFPIGKSPDGTPWAPKSQTTLERYKRKGDRIDTRPLYGPTGMLSSQIFPDHGPDFAEVGSNRIYAAVMQFGAAKGAFGSAANGSPIPWGHIPARPFLGTSEDDRTNILAEINEWLSGLATP